MIIKENNMRKFKNFMGKYGFFIASICFFISYILDEKGKSTNLVFALSFLSIGLAHKKKKTK